MNKKRNKKVTLSIDSAIYDSFRDYCDLNAILLSKKIELWMKKELEHPEVMVLVRPSKDFAKKHNKKVTLSINCSVYQQFRDYCEVNAIMLSKKVELWMKRELEK